MPTVVAVSFRGPIFSSNVEPQGLSSRVALTSVREAPVVGRGPNFRQAEENSGCFVFPFPSGVLPRFFLACVFCN